MQPKKPRRGFMREVVICASVVMTSTLASAQPASRVNEQPDATMQHLIDNYARHHHGKVAIYARDLRSGRTAALDPDVPVGTASVIKLAIMLEAMYQVKERRISF